MGRKSKQEIKWHRECQAHRKLARLQYRKNAILFLVGLIFSFLLTVGLIVVGSLFVGKYDQSPDLVVKWFFLVIMPYVLAVCFLITTCLSLIYSIKYFKKSKVEQQKNIEVKD